MPDWALESCRRGTDDCRASSCRWRITSSWSPLKLSWACRMQLRQRNQIGKSNYFYSYFACSLYSTSLIVIQMFIRYCRNEEASWQWQRNSTELGWFNWKSFAIFRELQNSPIAWMGFLWVGRKIISFYRSPPRNMSVLAYVLTLYSLSLSCNFRRGRGDDRFRRFINSGPIKWSPAPRRHRSGRNHFQTFGSCRKLTKRKMELNLQCGNSKYKRRWNSHVPWMMVVGMLFISLAIFNNVKLADYSEMPVCRVGGGALLSCLLNEVKELRGGWRRWRSQVECRCGMRWWCTGAWKLLVGWLVFCVTSDVLHYLSFAENIFTSVNNA